MTDLKIDDLNNEKERLVSDRETLLKRLDELQKSTQQIQTQIQAIGGAIQTCDYFIGKFNNRPKNPILNQRKTREMRGNRQRKINHG